MADNQKPDFKPLMRRPNQLNFVQKLDEVVLSFLVCIVRAENLNHFREGNAIAGAGVGLLNQRLEVHLGVANGDNVEEIEKLPLGDASKNSTDRQRV